MFDVCTKVDTAHIDTIFKFLPHTCQHVYIQVKETEMFAYSIQFLSIHELKIITAFLNTHRNISILFPQKCHLIHCLIHFVPIILMLFVNHVLQFKFLAIRMPYVKVDCRHLNPDVKMLKKDNGTAWTHVIWLSIKTTGWLLLNW